LTHPYIQPNSPIAFARIVFDLDWHQSGHKLGNLPIRYLAEASAWENDLALPEPSWVALSKEKNSAHIGYELATPVGRHEAARAQPQRYLAAIESAYCEKLMADSGFSGAFCKNPLNEAWDLYTGHVEPYDLHDLAEYVQLNSTRFQKFNREPRGEVGRNVYLFDILRFWAYDCIDDSRPLGFERWLQQVSEKAIQLNSVGYSGLPDLMGRGLLSSSECRNIGKSVATWTWANHGKRVLTPRWPPQTAPLMATQTAPGRTVRLWG
jgi:hypothetical protein